MDIKTPTNWRKGQTIFNFLWWLQTNKNYPPEIGAEGRMADPFHIGNADLDRFFEEFLKDHPKQY